MHARTTQPMPSAFLIVAGGLSCFVVTLSAAGEPYGTAIAGMFFVVILAFLTDRLVRLSVSLCNRTVRWSRQPPANGPVSVSAEVPRDQTADSLRQKLHSARQLEEALVEAYESRACAAEEVVRAKAIRLQAEINLVRSEHPLRSWPDECRRCGSIGEPRGDS